MRSIILVPVCWLLSQTGAPGSRLLVLRHVIPSPRALWYQVWQVTPPAQAGALREVAPFRYKFPTSYDDESAGSTMPSPSPDGRWIAFGQFGGDYDLQLLDVQSGRERRITRYARPPRKGYAYADVLLGGWSPNSDALLFTVAPGETTSEWGELQVPDAAYGSYIYNLVNRTTSCVTLPKGFQFVAWLPDGRFLGVIPSKGHGEQDKLVLAGPDDTTGTEVRTPQGTPRHVRVSADGKWLTGLLARERERRGTAQIVKINLVTLSVDPLARLASWTGNESPALSPDNSRIAYRRDMGMVKGIPQTSLLVGRRRVYSCPDMLDFQWVDTTTVAVACQREIILVDATTGQAGTRYALPAGSAEEPGSPACMRPRLLWSGPLDQLKYLLNNR